MSDRLPVTGVPASVASLAMPGRFRLHHVGIVVRHLEPVLAAYFSAFETSYTSIPFDDGAQHVRVAFACVAPGVFLEFVQPVGDCSPVAGFLARNPTGGLHHLAFEVADIETAIQEFLRARATVVCHPVRGFEGRRVAFLFPKIEPRILIELVEPAPVVT